MSVRVLGPRRSRGLAMRAPLVVLLLLACGEQSRLASLTGTLPAFAVPALRGSCRSLGAISVANIHAKPERERMSAVCRPLASCCVKARLGVVNF